MKLVRFIGFGLIVFLVANIGSAKMFKPEDKQVFIAYINMAKPIASAAKAYCMANGAYPDDLPSMVPDYLGRIPDIPGYDGILRDTIYTKVLANEGDKYLYGFEISIIPEKKRGFWAALRDVGYRERIYYTPSEDYPNRMHVKTLFTIDGWAVQRISRGYSDDITIIDSRYEESLY